MPSPWAVFTSAPCRSNECTPSRSPRIAASATGEALGAANERERLVRLLGSLDDVPDSHLRPLAQFYISQIFNKPLELRDSVGPLEMIPVEAEMFGSEPEAAPKSKKKK